MKHVFEDIEGPVGWGTALLLAFLSIPLAAFALLLIRTFLVPLLIAGVVLMALLAVFVPPRYRDWVSAGWRVPRTRV